MGAAARPESHLVEIINNAPFKPLLAGNKGLLADIQGLDWVDLAMKSNQCNYTILLSLLSGLLPGLSVNHVFGVFLSFLFPVCLIGIFAALEKQAARKSWLLHGYLFSLVSFQRFFQKEFSNLFDNTRNNYS